MADLKKILLRVGKQAKQFTKELSDDANKLFSIITEIDGSVKPIELSDDANKLFSIFDMDNNDAIAKLARLIGTEEESGATASEGYVDPVKTRGIYCETILHRAVLLQRFEIADWLISNEKWGRQLASAVYTGREGNSKCEYEGETTLHICAVSLDERAFTTAKNLLDLLDADAASKAKATGSFFVEMRYGQTPTSFAAAMGNCKLIDEIRSRNIDVLGEMDEMYGQKTATMVAMEHGQAGALRSLLRRKDSNENDNGMIEHVQTLIPFAAASSDMEILTALIDSQKIVDWTFGNVVGVKHDKVFIETLVERISDRYNSALITHPTVLKLLQHKWNLYAHARFRWNFIFVVLYLGAYAIATWPNLVIKPGHGSAHALVQLSVVVLSVMVFLSEIVPLFRQIKNILRHDSALDVIKVLTMGPAVFVLLLLSHCVLTVVGLAFAWSYDTDNYVYRTTVPWASVLGFLYLLRFFAGFKLTGSLVAMIRRIVVNDLGTFFLIFAVILYAFAHGLCVLYSGRSDGEKPPDSFRSLASSIMTLFLMSMGEINIDDFDSNYNQIVAYSMFVIFSILSAILLLNLLIAMMSESFALVDSRAENEFRSQWADIIVSIERNRRQVSTMLDWLRCCCCRKPPPKVQPISGDEEEKQTSPKAVKRDMIVLTEPLSTDEE